MNFFDVTLKGNKVTNEKGLTLEVPQGKLNTLHEHGFKDGAKLVFGIRPEDIKSEQVALDASPGSVVTSKVTVSELLGAETMLYSQVGELEFIAKVDARDYHAPGKDIDLAFDMGKSHYFDPESTDVIR